MMCSIPILILIPIQFSFAWELHGNSIPMGTLMRGMRVPMCDVCDGGKVGVPKLMIF